MANSGQHHVLNMGVKGAAIATIISTIFVILSLIYWFYIKKDTYLNPYLSNFTFSKNISKDIIKVGIPASIQLLNNALFTALYCTLLTYVGSTDAVAVFSIGWRVILIGITPVLAIGTTLISVVGANYGARNYRNIKVAHRYSMKISLLISFVVLIFMMAFAKDISSLFASGDNSVAIALQLTSFLMWISLHYPTVAVGLPSSYLFHGVGKGITAMVQTVLRETVFTLFFAVLLAVFLGYGVWGAWVGIVLGEVVSNNLTLLWAYVYIKKLINING